MKTCSDLNLYNAPVLSCAHYFQAPATQARTLSIHPARTLTFNCTCGFSNLKGASFAYKIYIYNLWLTSRRSLMLRAKISWFFGLFREFEGCTVLQTANWVFFKQIANNIVYKIYFNNVRLTSRRRLMLLIKMS